VLVPDVSGVLDPRRSETELLGEGEAAVLYFPADSAGEIIAGAEALPAATKASFSAWTAATYALAAGGHCGR
jgi:hypothetical protein